ncbi:MAG TPA: hypothetical protein VM123_01905 [archaeon]|nr:hypothetical protein [archaeon]
MNSGKMSLSPIQAQIDRSELKLKRMKRNGTLELRKGEENLHICECDGNDQPIRETIDPGLMWLFTE